MSQLRDRIRSVLLWSVSLPHFVVCGTFFAALTLVMNPRRFDPLVRLFFRNQLRLAGARLEVHRHPDFDPDRTCVFVCNHVNLFDPFVAYSSVPQFLRGLELASHFKIPVYGWMMGIMGNVPVPDGGDAAGLREMNRLARKAIDEGTSLLVFPEGTRTRTGALGRFHPGAFRLAQQLGVPVVPMTQVGSFRLKQVKSWILRPTKITVHFHRPIETAEMERSDVKALRDAAREAVEGPLLEAGIGPAPVSPRSDGPAAP
ncbi:MAG: 1-acyl-sn-glycerol-3-phosphate acyltransferase [Gemmatimonadetes bacterium]|nr:1-acyl-sn-glycerol-3-phosphate acyltransferase [Gemmatimonadota bacterium]